MPTGRTKLPPAERTCHCLAACSAESIVVFDSSALGAPRANRSQSLSLISGAGSGAAIQVGACLLGWYACCALATRWLSSHLATAPAANAPDVNSMRRPLLKLRAQGARSNCSTWLPCSARHYSSSATPTSTASFPRITSINELNDWLHHTYGDKILQRLQRGIKHVTLLHSPSYKTIRNTITPKAAQPTAPTHPADLLALLCTRAAADLVVITGRVVREEPQYTFQLHDKDEQLNELLTKWRYDMMKRKSALPDVAILTKSGSLTSDQSADSTVPTLVATAAQDKRNVYVTNQKLVDSMRTDDPSLPLHYLRADSLGDTLQSFKSNLQYSSISIEAGPHTTLPLYESMMNGELLGSIDTLLLTLYNGKLQDESKQLVDTSETGLRFTPSYLRRLYARRGQQAYDDSQNNGQWLLARYDRKSTDWGSV